MSAYIIDLAKALGAKDSGGARSGAHSGGSNHPGYSAQDETRSTVAPTTTTDSPESPPRQRERGVGAAEGVRPAEQLAREVIRDEIARWVSVGALEPLLTGILVRLVERVRAERR